MPEFRRLLLQRRNQLRMAVTQRVHRNPRGEVEIALAIGGCQPTALAALEAEAARLRPPALAEAKPYAELREMLTGEKPPAPPPEKAP